MNHSLALAGKCSKDQEDLLQKQRMQKTHLAQGDTVQERKS